MQKPSLKKNARGVWEIRWSEKQPDGRWRSRTWSTRQTDRDVAEQVLAGWVSAQQDLPDRKAMTFKTLSDEYFKAKSLKSNPFKMSRSMGHMLRHFGPMLLSDITSRAVMAYRLDRMSGAIGDKAVMASTAYQEVRVLKTIMNYAVKQKYITALDVPDIGDSTPAKPREIYLSERDEEHFLRLAAATSAGLEYPTRIHRFVWIALNTAARRNAIETLHWDAVDMERGLIDYRHGQTRQSRKRRAVVPISDRLFPLLEWAWKTRSSEWVLDEPTDIMYEFRAWVDQSPFPHIRPHDLRRTWATLAARAGVSLFDIAGVLGDNPTTVQKHYAHHAPGHLRNAVNFRSEGVPQMTHTPSEVQKRVVTLS